MAAREGLRHNISRAGPAKDREASSAAGAATSTPTDQNSPSASLPLLYASSDTVCIVSFILKVSEGRMSLVLVSLRSLFKAFAVSEVGATGKDFNLLLRLPKFCYLKLPFLDDIFRLSFSFAWSLMVGPSGYIGWGISLSFFNSSAIALSGSSLIRLVVQKKGWISPYVDFISWTSFFFSSRFRA